MALFTQLSLTLSLGPQTVGHVSPALQAFSGWVSGPVDHNHCFKEQDFLEVKPAEQQAGHTVFRELLTKLIQTAFVRVPSQEIQVVLRSEYPQT